MFARALLRREACHTHTCRATDYVLGVHLWGIASGKDFGSAVYAKGKEVEDEGKVDYKAAHWEARCQLESSNWREAQNLTSRDEDMGARGRLTVKEMILLMDNNVFKNIYYKGHLSSSKLNATFFRLHKFKQETGASSVSSTLRGLA